MPLNPREKKLMILTGVLIAGGLVYLAVVAPARDRLATLRRVIPEKQAALVQLRQMADQYQTLQTRMTQFQQTATASDQDLLGTLEELCQRAGIAAKVTQMTQSTTVMNDRYLEVGVNLSLAALTQTELVTFLSQVKQGPLPVCVRTLAIRKNTARPDVLDITLLLTQPRRQAS